MLRHYPLSPSFSSNSKIYTNKYRTIEEGNMPKNTTNLKNSSAYSTNSIINMFQQC